MTTSVPTGTATDEELALLLQRLGSGAEDDIGAIDALLSLHAEDARLYFLRGSVLAGLGRALEAHQALTRAVQLAPDFAIARFQLGFFELTSGEPSIALENWAHLDGLPAGHYLGHFVTGLRALIADDFINCISQLEQGIAANVENPPLNHDMQLIIDQCRSITASGSGDANVAAPDERADADVSATALLLGRFGSGGGKSH